MRSGIYRWVKVGLAISSLSAGQAAWAQGNAPNGTTCQAPTFRFRWVDVHSVNLVVAADPAGLFNVIICPLGAANCPGTGSLGPIAAAATPDGAETPLPAPGLTDFNLLESGGQVRIAFHSDDAQDCNARLHGTTSATVLEKHHLKIDVGTSYNLAADGSFKNKLELSLNAQSRWTSWLTGIVDSRFDSLAPVQSSQQTSQQNGQQSGSQSGAQQGGSQSSGQSNATQFNPFTSGGVTFDGTARAAFHPWGRQWSNPPLAVIVGAGVRTVPTSNNSSGSSNGTQAAPTAGSGGGTQAAASEQDSAPTGVDARPRYFVGGRLQVLGYNGGNPAKDFAGARGYLEVGRAWDRFWLVQPGTGVGPTFDQQNRWYVEGQLELPKVGSKDVKVLVRAFMSLPTSHQGPSEFRISALASIDPGFLSSILGGGAKTAANQGQ